MLRTQLDQRCERSRAESVRALALIEFAWSAAVLLLEKSDFQSWTAGVVRKLMWIGAFYTLLLFGPTWIPAIVDSFIALGQNAAGTGALAPGDVYTRGLQIAGSLLKGSSDAGFFTNFGSAFALVLAAFMAFLAFLVITVQFVVALVESYIVVSAGFIFLGFGGSRWTAPYVERYIGLAVSVGVKIMILYLLIGSGMTLSNGWLSAAVSVPTTASPSMSALDIVGAALIFMADLLASPQVNRGRDWRFPGLEWRRCDFDRCDLSRSGLLCQFRPGGWRPRRCWSRWLDGAAPGSGGSNSPGSGRGKPAVIHPPVGLPVAAGAVAEGSASSSQPPTPGYGSEKIGGGGATQVSPPSPAGRGNQGSGGTSPSRPGSTAPESVARWDRQQPPMQRRAPSLERSCRRPMPRPMLRHRA